VTAIDALKIVDMGATSELVGTVYVLSFMVAFGLDCTRLNLSLVYVP
jgi:hypothetical protein